MPIDKDKGVIKVYDEFTDYVSVEKHFSINFQLLSQSYVNIFMERITSVRSISIAMLVKTLMQDEQSKYVHFNADTFHDHQYLQCNLMTSLLIILLMNDRISSKNIEVRRLIKYL